MDPTAAAPPTPGQPADDGNAPESMPRADVQGRPITVQVTGTASPRPKPDERTTRFTKKWIDRTEDVPDFDAALRAAKQCQQTLFPAWWDPSDPWKGRGTRETRKREDDRRVNTPLAFLNITQTVAMTCPQEHRAKWLPDDEVPADDGSASPMAKFLRRFGRTIETVSKKYLREIGIQDILEAWVRDSTSFPMGILKVFFSRDLATDPTSEGGEPDEQDNQARVREIGEDLARGTVDQTDPRLIELRNLLEGMGGKSEVELWEGMIVENLQLSRVRVAKEVQSLETIYSAPWISNDIDMMVSEVKQRFAYTLNADGTWTGVHPDDLADATSADSSAFGRGKGGRMKPRPDRPTFGENKLQGLAGSGQEDHDDRKKLVVREVWAKCDNKVYVFIKGVPYPVHQWTPERTPAQWYPYIFNVPNPLFSSIYGVSDAELQADEQSRINRKRSDEEKARFDNLPRHFFNSASMTEAEAKPLMNGAPPHSWTPIRLGADGFKSDVFTVEGKNDPAAFDTTRDMQNLQRAALLPEQATGVTGSAQFAEEVKVAAQGSSIAARFRQNRITRAMERFYDVVAQILLQEVGPDQAKELAGQNAVWPTIYSDQDGKAKLAEIRAQVQQQIMQQVIAGAPTDPATGMPSLPPLESLRPQLEQQMQDGVAQACLAQFGFPEPLTREVLYRRMRVSVSVALDGQVDRQSRLQGVLKIFQALAEAGQAQMASGIRLNMLPMLRQLVAIVGADEDMYDEMFGADAGAAAQQLVQAVQSGQQIDPQAAMQVIQAMQPAIAPLLAAQAQAQAAQHGAPGGAGPGGPPARPGHPPIPGPGAGAPPPAAAGPPPAGILAPQGPPPGLGTGPQAIG